MGQLDQALEQLEGILLSGDCLRLLEALPADLDRAAAREAARALRTLLAELEDEVPEAAILQILVTEVRVQEALVGPGHRVITVVERLGDSARVLIEEDGEAEEVASITGRFGLDPRAWTPPEQAALSRALAEYVREEGPLTGSYAPRPGFEWLLAALA